MKLIGIAILIISSTALGISLAYNSYVKLKICDELIDFADTVKIDFNYYSTPIKTLIPKLISNYKFIGFIDENLVTAKKALNTGLTKSENEIISSFFINLGKTDTSTQISLINGFIEQIAKMQDKYKQSYSKNSKLYISFGLFGGIMASLLLS